MSPSGKRLLAGAAAVLVLIAAGVAGFFRVLSKRVPTVPAEVVPASWAEFRTSPGHQQHVGKGTISCKDCHNYEVEGFKNPGAGICSRCHEQQMAHTHAGGEQKTDCLACHLFAPGQAPTCVTCHAEAQGHTAAVSVHLTAACNECHHPHATPAIAPRACIDCHDERAMQHAQHAGSTDCLDCHHAHEPARAARATCSTCHLKPAGPKPAGHDSCLTCHKPHDFVAQRGQVCLGCHGTKPTLLAATVAAHTRCTSCHAPHAPAQAESSCQVCHKEVHVAHDGQAACVSCHAPHKGDVNARASACTGCHQKIAASDSGVHAGGTTCTTCHKPHGFPLPVGAASCGRCHGGETQLASVNRGHRDCTSCHGVDAHHPTKAPACSTCHAQEMRSAPRGHQKCASCHEVHAGTRIAQAATCTNCHAKQASALHGSLKGGCETCHRAHGPSGVAAPPPCTSCHQTKTLPALHQIASHGTCNQCHSSHAPPRSDRQTCTGSCHLDRRKHQPAAQVCSGCHVFRS